MQAQADVVRWLNRVLENELTAINQYFLHCRMFEDIASYEYVESIDGREHADRLVQRVLFLDGLARPGTLDQTV